MDGRLRNVFVLICRYNFAFESIRKAGIQRRLIPDMVRESHAIVRYVSSFKSTNRKLHV